MLSPRNQFLIAEIAALCQDTAAAILSYYYSDAIDVSWKDNGTPLTEADLCAHRLLSQGLTRILPLPIVSEESSREAQGIQNGDYWLIDPIDGTREFIEKTGQFCMLIARIQGARPTLAYLYAPVLQTAWYAAAGEGSYRENEQGRLRLHCQPVNTPPIITTSRRSMGPSMQTYLAENFGNYQHLITGSALKFCAIAEGRADVYPKISATTNEWDIAAGDLLLCEAGGGVQLLDGAIPHYGCKENPLNPPFLAHGIWPAEALAHACKLIRNCS